MPPLSEFAKMKKARYFLDRISTDHHILEIGCGRGWVKDYLINHGYTHYTGIDIVEPADIVGDVRSWKSLGLNQKRTSPHNHLIPLSLVPYFEHTDIRIVAFLSQRGILTKDPRQA